MPMTVASKNGCADFTVSPHITLTIISGGDGAPDLRFDRILAVADEAFDTQMLLDPLEEQFAS